MIDLKEKKEIKNIIDECEKVALIVTEKGAYMSGRESEILTVYSALTNTLSKEIPKEILEFAFSLAFKEKDEYEALSSIMQKVQKDLKDLFDKI